MRDGGARSKGLGTAASDIRPRWSGGHGSSGQGRQIALDEANGSGLLLTLEPAARVPSGDQFLAESRTFLQQQKATILRTEPPRRIQAAPQELEHFALEAEVNRQRVWMDYYVIRQAGGGATLAARLLPADRAALQKEIERIARSVTVANRN